MKKKKKISNKTTSAKAHSVVGLYNIRFIDIRHVKLIRHVEYEGVVILIFSSSRLSRIPLNTAFKHHTPFYFMGRIIEF